MAAHTGESIFNLGTGRGYSVLEMVHAFEAANHVHVPYRIAPRRAGDRPSGVRLPGQERAHPRLARGLLARGYVPRQLRWQTQNPNGYETA